MDIQKLKYFLYLAEFKNFTKAAEHFYIGQPAFSRQIFSLEKELGTPLFVRNNRTVQLTAAGEILQKEGTQLIDRINYITEKVQLAGKGTIGALSVASLGHFHDIIPMMIQNFLLKYPNIQFRIERYGISELNDAILNGNFDLGITFEYCAPESEELEKEFLCKEQYCVLSAKASNISKRGTQITSKDLLEQNLILLNYADPPFYKQIFHNNIDIQKNQELRPHITYTSSMESVLLQVTSGLGVTIVPTFIVSDSKTNGHFSIQYLSDIDTREDVTLVWRKDNYNPALKKFIELARE